MIAYQLFDRLQNYKGTLGAATKENIFSIDAPPIDQHILPRNLSAMDALRDGATSWITDGSRGYRYERDMNLDLKNPRQELPKDSSGILAMNAIPYQTDQKIDLARPEDYEASNGVLLLQQAVMNSQKQDSLFTDPKAMEGGGPDGFVGGADAQGRNSKGMSQEELYSMGGSATGNDDNRLYLDEDGTINSIESIVNF